MIKITSFVNKTMVLMLAFVIVFSYSVVPVNNAYAAVRKPSKVNGIKAVAKSNYTIKITWKKAKYANKYQVYRSTSKKGKYKKTATVNGTSYVNSNLKKGKKYFYKVRAVNGNKKGAYSSIKCATTKKSSLYDVAVDKTNKTVTIYAKVNGRFFNESTRHLVVDQSGFNKGKAILTSFCTPEDLYYGLVKAGGISWSKSQNKKLRAGEKNTVKNAENKKFSKLDISIAWGDKTYNLSECLTTELGGIKVPEINMVFSGNPKAAAKTPSGCVVCMDSCYIGIAANSAYGLCEIDKGNPTLYARPDIMPSDKTIVKVILTIK